MFRVTKQSSPTPLGSYRLYAWKKTKEAPFWKAELKVTEPLQTHLLLPLLNIYFFSPAHSNVLYFPKENPEFLAWHIKQVPASSHVLEWPLSDPNTSPQAVSISITHTVTFPLSPFIVATVFSLPSLEMLSSPCYLRNLDQFHDLTKVPPLLFSFPELSPLSQFCVLLPPSISL